jgi:hypothetical protein
MNLGQETINIAAKLLLKNQVWADAKYFVQDLADHDLTNEAKHEKVKKDLFAIFGDIGSTILDIAIKLAVLWLKAQVKETK